MHVFFIFFQNVLVKWLKCTIFAADFVKIIVTIYINNLKKGLVMKDHWSSHYHEELRHWPEEEALNYFKEHCLSIDDMLDIRAQRNRGYHNINYDINLKTDEESGKIYVDHDFLRCKDLLKNHLLLETLYARKDEVDWERVSNHYDYEVVDKIGDTLTSPLVWVPSEEAGEHCAVKGKVAKEVNPIEGYDNHDRYELYHHMMDEGVLWFVDHLPEYSEEFHHDRYGFHFPPGILLWDRFLQAQFGHAYYGDLLKKLQFVAKERGGAKAAEIVKRLRKDWPHIMREKLFGISDLNKFEMGTVLKIEEQLNGELELYLQKWEAETTKTSNNRTKLNISQKKEPTTPVDRAIKAVYDSNLCYKKPGNWAAVIRIFKERHLRQYSGLDYDADYINMICGEKVTNDLALKRSLIVDSVEGTFSIKDDKKEHGWRLKAGTENPKSKGLLKRYMEIGKIVVSILDEGEKE